MSTPATAVSEIGPPRQDLSGKTWLNAEQGAEYIGCSTPDAFRQWAYRHKVPKYWRGGKKIWKREDLDASMSTEPPHPRTRSPLAGRKPKGQ